MKILFDQGTPVPLRRALSKHEVATAFERGWSALQNGELLQVAEAEGFDVLVTTDQNLRYQQNLPERRLAIVVFKTTNWPRIRKRLEIVTAAIDGVQPGSYSEIEI
jgi:predicted nuclease of predicted toxin-antitoxin system